MQPAVTPLSDFCYVVIQHPDPDTSPCLTHAGRIKISTTDTSHPDSALGLDAIDLLAEHFPEVLLDFCGRAELKIELYKAEYQFHSSSSSKETIDKRQNQKHEDLQ